MQPLCPPRLPSSHQVGAILRLGLAVAATFAVAWAPWLATPGGALGVLRRIFPTQRGLYEDYVANWWCASSRLIKWARLLPQPSLVKLCGATTLAALAPAGVLAARRPTPRAFLLCLANSAMAFFLFSYQVGGTGPVGAGSRGGGTGQSGMACAWLPCTSCFASLRPCPAGAREVDPAAATAAGNAAEW